MPKILHTRDMEQAVRGLAARYERVLVRNKHILWKPIRLRRAALADLEPRIVLNPPQFDSELHAWNREGGVLVYDRAFKRDENIAAHHAQFITECPLSIEMIERVSEGTREAVVVYLPPNWREHERGVRDTFPDAATCERVYRMAQRGARPSQALLDALGAKEEGRVISDVEIISALKLSSAHLHRIRSAMLRKREWKMVNPVVLRIAPEDATEAQVYRFIERECPKIDGAHLIVGAKLSKAMRFWRVALRALERRGAIARRDTLYFYALDGLEPDWKKVARTYEGAKENLRRVAAFIEAAPEFNPRETRTSRSPARQATSPQSFAA